MPYGKKKQKPAGRKCSAKNRVLKQPNVKIPLTSRRKR